MNPRRTAPLSREPEGGTLFRRTTSCPGRFSAKAYRVAMFAGAVLAAQPGAALAAAPGSQLAAACASCHRTDGHGGGIPPIAGVDESRIVQLMLANRADPSHSQIMHVVASALTPEEIAAVAHYLASQPAEGQP